MTTDVRESALEPRSATAFDTIATAAGPTAAEIAAPMIDAVFQGPPRLQLVFWDGSTIGPHDGPGQLVLNTPDALRRIMWAPGELGFARAYISGDLDFVGPIGEVLRAFQASLPTESDQDPTASEIRNGLVAGPKAVAALRSLGALGKPLPPPREEIVPRGRRHSIRRDKVAVSHHYDVGNEFYSLVLGPSMTYSCARFADRGMSLEDAQAAKHELICRKLGLRDRPSARLLDVGCGWGSMAIHAATNHGARVVGVTISNEQAAEARRRVEAAGVSDRVEIRIQDYRRVADGPFDAISSVGMAEHVGERKMDDYFGILRSLLRPGGRMLNHAISTVGGSRLRRRGFVYRYVFPDGELLDVGNTVLSMERAGFEVRDVESLREHYAATLREWVANLERNWDEAVELVGEGRARVWLLYMSGSVNNFDDNNIAVHQVLGVVPETNGASHMPPTRAGWDA
ncbi:MAG TPA: cyclopropane-fatty-acyl-phospholipid synthase family protein [Ilumatobacteraceae bacterium]|nr:cyclopropane-fatty-acyl-phospholipid synthase family protein [Ilumatobacteraceae bacterium]